MDPLLIAIIVAVFTLIVLFSGIPIAFGLSFVSIVLLVSFEGLTPKMIEALAEDGIKTLEDFATCADWELAGGWTTVDGERVKDDGLLENFDVSLEEAQDLVMTARIVLGWVDPNDLITESLDADDAAEAEAES